MMGKYQPQPAAKSYFFGQGFKDIGTAIKRSWQKNAQTAKEFYTKYDAAGFMSLKGIYNLFCALSVVSFGTVFFALISLIMVLVVSVFFVLVYIGFAIVWTIDRVYLISKRISVACTVCKRKYLIPTYICPRCGKEHTNLTPGQYGILKRTCLCGEKLPTTFMNGRKKLKAICPGCREDGVVTPIYDRESRPFCVPVVGGRSVGKTAFITAFSKRFVEFTAPESGIDIEIYNAEKNAIYEEIKADFAHGSTRMTARAQDIRQVSSVSFSFFAKHKTLSPERLVHIYDIAGEVFTDSNENEVQRQYEYCQGMIFLIDPFAIPSVYAGYGDRLTPQDKAGIGKADIMGVIDVFMNKLREVTGLSDNQMSQIPLAVVIGKIDSAGLAHEFSQEKIEELQYFNPETTISQADAIDVLCRRFLADNGMQGFLNAVDMKFKYNRYFAVSAIGHTRDAGAYSPIGVMAPMEWICSRSDKAFARLWVKGTYSQKPLVGLKTNKEG